MLRSLKGFPLLDGFRGGPRADIAAIAQAVSAFSVLVAEAGERVQEAEVNPLICRPLGLPGGGRAGALREVTYQARLG